MMYELQSRISCCLHAVLQPSITYRVETQELRTWRPVSEMKSVKPIVKNVQMWTRELFLIVRGDQVLWCDGKAGRFRQPARNLCLGLSGALRGVVPPYLNTTRGGRAQRKSQEIKRKRRLIGILDHQKCSYLCTCYVLWLMDIYFSIHRHSTLQERPIHIAFVQSHFLLCREAFASLSPAAATSAIQIIGRGVV